ncbi:MAG: hypothetical protein LBK91_04130, partial [Synergistaceae bacterium]|nr:hypothetical protein [Synergistaceae bacterium]
MRPKLKSIRTIILTAVVLALLPAVPAVWSAETDKEAWEALTRKYESKEEARREREAQAQLPVSDDEAVRGGAWYQLAGKYGNIYASDPGGEAISPELLSSWWNELKDGTLDGLIMDALSNNRDLRAARSRMMEARAELGISKSAGL